MAKITAKDVNALRQKTGMGMMECKKALTDTDGDVEKATELLRERAGGKMDTRDRAAGEGAIVAVHGSGAVGVAQVMAETDFSARNDGFLAKTREIAELALASDQNGELEPTDAMKQIVEDLRITIKENISLKRVYRLEGETVSSYIHTDNKKGAILAAAGDADNDTLRGVCQHITAAVPPLMEAAIAVDADGLPADQVEAKKAEFIAEAEATGKPAEIAEKISMGKLNKWKNELTLLGQPYVKDMSGKTSVGQSLPKGTTITSFVRFEVSG